MWLILHEIICKKLNDVIQNTKAVVIPSEWYENNPMSVIESFAMGKPAIGARIGGIPELIKENETGLTYKSGNAEDLANKINAMLSDENSLITYGQNARQYVENTLSADVHYKKLMKVSYGA